MKSCSIPILLLLSLFLLQGCAGPAQTGSEEGIYEEFITRYDYPGYELTVDAGSHDRRETVIGFELPEPLTEGNYLLERASGGTIYLQVRGSRGYFVLEEVAAGETKRFLLHGERLPDRSYPPAVTATVDSADLIFSTGETTGLVYRHREMEPPEGVDPRFRRAGFLHPVNTPSGQAVSRLFNPDRPHQYGIWSAWNRVEFQGRELEFWAALEESGRVEPGELIQAWAGSVFGGFRATHRYSDHSVNPSAVVLEESWELLLFPSMGEGRFHLIDLDLRQQAVAGEAVRVLEGGYGGISIRGADVWDGPGNMDFSNSEGYDRRQVQNRPVRWGHLSGELDGERAGVALMGPPDFEDQPFGVFINQNHEPFFSLGPAALGPLEIGPDSSWQARYRLVVHDGVMSDEELERLWLDYADPPAVTVEKVEP